MEGSSVMHRRVSAFIGYSIEAPDGKVGSVSDVLFEDDTWKLRWFVIDTGPWLAGRKILIHPESVGRPDIRQRAFPVTLMKSEVEAGRTISSDPPVALQMDPMQDDSYFLGPILGADYDGSYGSTLSGRPISDSNARQWQGSAPIGDPHLRSLSEVTGYHIHALDGDIGHLEDFLVDDESWKIESAVVNTKNWGFGTHVLVSHEDIKGVYWSEREIFLQLTRYKIKSSPSWKEPDFSDLPAH